MTIVSFITQCFIYEEFVIANSNPTSVQTYEDAKPSIPQMIKTQTGFLSLGREDCWNLNPLDLGLFCTPSDESCDLPLVELDSMFWKKKFLTQSRIFNERAARIRFLAPHLKMILNQPQTGQLEILDISETGIAFTAESLDFEPSLGTTLAGQIELGNKMHTVQCQVVHLTPPSVGCKLIAPSVEFRQQLKEQFDPELHAHALVQVDTKLLKRRPDGTPFYYRADAQTELYFVTAGVDLISFTMMFAGHYIEGGVGRPTRAGHLKTELKEKVQDPSSPFPVDGFTEITPILMHKAQSFLVNIDQLSVTHRDLLFRYLSDSSNAEVS